MNEPIIILYFSIAFLTYSFIKLGKIRLAEIIASICFIVLALLSTLLPNRLASSAIISFLFITSVFSSKIIKNTKIGIIKLGIIDFVWLSLMGITCGGLIYFRSILELQSVIPKPTSAVVQAQINQYQFVLGKSIDIVLVLGSIVAVCMSIIWSKDVWRDENKKDEYVSTTKSSIGMAFACLSICSAVLLWISQPLYMRINECISLLK